MGENIRKNLEYLFGLIVTNYLNYAFVTIFIVGLTVGFGVGYFVGIAKEVDEDPGVKVEKIVLGDISKVKEIGEVEVKTEKKNQSVGNVCVEVAGAIMTPGVYCLEVGNLVINAVNMAGGINIQSYADRYVSRNMNLARPLIPNEKIYIPFQDEQLCSLREFAYVEEKSEGKELSILNQIKLVLEEITENVTNLDGDIVSKVSDIQNQIDETDAYTKGESDDNSESISDSSECIKLNSATVGQLIEIDGVGESTALNIIEARPYESIEELLDVSGIGDSKYAAIKESVCL